MGNWRGNRDLAEFAIAGGWLIDLGLPMAT